MKFSENKVCNINSNHKNNQVESGVILVETSILNLKNDLQEVSLFFESHFIIHFIILSLLMNQVHLRSALSLRDLCCVNGGAYIKVGQYVGSLDYLLPSEYVQTMKVLHNDAPRSPLGDIHHVIEEELHCKVNEVFVSFEEKPIGAASLAQVHRATLHDGRVVAVKVQHRDVQKHAAVDMATLEVSVKTIMLLKRTFPFQVEI